MFAPFIKEGIGLHSGSRARILVEMGLPDSGVVFFADDEPIAATPERVSSSHPRATALTGEQQTVATVEHLLAALAAFGEKDVRITVEGPEIPILDGSALPFFESIKRHVCQCWGDDSPLRTACFGGIHFSFVDEATFKPLAQDFFVRWDMCQ